MARFPNKDKVSNLHMYGIKRKFFCPIGQSVCTYVIEIDMEPDMIICDYLDVASFISNMKMEYTLEGACGAICNYMAGEYQPYAVMVKVKCEDAKHMPVEVTNVVNRSFAGNGQYEYN